MRKNWPIISRFFQYQKPKETYYKVLEDFLTISVQVVRSLLQELRS